MHTPNNNRSNKDENADNQEYSIKPTEVRRTTSLRSHSIRFYSLSSSKIVTSETEREKNACTNTTTPQTECCLKSFSLDYCVFHVLPVYSHFSQ